MKLFNRAGNKPERGTRCTEIKLKEILCEATQEYQVRELAFLTCVNLIANAMGRCEFRTFEGNKEVRKEQYFLWNIEPNANQNSTEFMHQLVAKLYEENEVLIVDEKKGKINGLVIADDWDESDFNPGQSTVYTGVRIGEETRANVGEADVIHLKLNNRNIKPVIDGLFQSYLRMLQAAMKYYSQSTGQRWKVHIEQLEDGEDEFAEAFQKQLEAQILPFLKGDSAILPEFDGYEYTDVSSNKGASNTRDIKALIDDVFEITAKGFLIPDVIVSGKVESTKDANTRFLTNCIDPLADQLSEEINRKRYGRKAWLKGDYLTIDTSSIIHFDLFSNASNIEKLVGSGTFSINDVLRAAGQPTINEPWANQHFITLNFGNMSEALSQLGKEDT